MDPHPPATPGPAGRDALALGAVAAAKLALHLATSHGYGIFRDELYYLACSEHLAWGYVDQPPLSIAILAAERALLGDSLAALRLTPALAGAATVFLAGWMARELGGGRRAQLLAAVATLVCPSTLVFQHFFSMNAFDVLFWAALGWLALRILARGEARAWLAFGAVAGLGLENKLSVLFLLFGLVMGLLATRERRWLATPWPWLAGLLALVLVAPHLVWQALHGWPTLEFQANARAAKNLPLSPLAFAGQQLLIVGPLAVPLWLTGLVALLLRPALRPLGIAYVAIFGLFVATTAKAYYLAPIYPLLFAAGSVTLENVSAMRRWVVPAYGALLLAGGVVILPFAIPVLPEETFVAYSHRIGITHPPAERNDSGALPQLFADMHGWQQLVDTVAAVAATLSPDERERAVVIARNYGEAGAIDFLGRPRGLPRAISGHNSYWLWGPGDWDGSVALVLGGDPAKLHEWFESVVLGGRVECRWCMPFENGVPVYVARGLRLPVAEAWRRIRHYE